MVLTILSTLLHTIEGDKRFHLSPGLGQMDKEQSYIFLIFAQSEGQAGSVLEKEGMAHKES